MCRISRRIDLYKGSLIKSATLAVPCASLLGGMAISALFGARSKPQGETLSRSAVPLLCPGSLMSSPRPTNDIPQGGEGQKAYSVLAYRARTKSHVDLMSCKEV
jgi:hypothetical protein